MANRFQNLFVFFLIGVLSYSHLYAQEAENYGLLFQSYNVPQEQRTSLQVGEGEYLPYGDDFSLSFDLSFVPGKNVYFGYVFRFVNRADQRISLLYDQKNLVFRLTVDGNYAMIPFPKTEDWIYNKWNRFVFRFTKESVEGTLNGKKLGAAPLSLTNNDFILVFGGGKDEHFYATDVPPMKLRNVDINLNDNPTYHFDLMSGQNERTEDNLKGLVARVLNPIWLSNRHSHWELLHKKFYDENASASFDPISDQVYILGADSVYRLKVDLDNSLTWKNAPSSNFKLFRDNQLLFNPNDSVLYDLYTDLHAVSSYNKVDGRWSAPFENPRPTEYNQSNIIFSPTENCVYIIGGYGQMRYKNSIQRYHFETATWDTVHFSGDDFNPRYLAAAALNGDSLYIIGGYGSKTGDQLLDPGYFYDLMVYNIKSHNFVKRFNVNPSGSEALLGGAMVLDSTCRNYFVFGFSNEKYDTELQLYKGSLDHPDLVPVGNKIPFQFNDVKSGISLHYLSDVKKLLLVTSIVKEGKGTEIAINTISFPPSELIEGESIVKTSSWKKSLPYIIGIGVLGLLFIIYYKRRRSANKKDMQKPDLSTAVDISAEQGRAVARELAPAAPEAGQTSSSPEKATPRRETEPQSHSQTVVSDAYLEEEPAPTGSFIYLFGNFDILDKEGNSIVAQLSPLLKELFLVILFHSIVQQTGIASKKLNEYFWNNKSDKDANNNRSVNIAKLKNVLENVESLSILNDRGRWFIQYDPAIVQIDLVAFLNLINQRDNVGRCTIRKVLTLFKKGSLLKNTEYHWLDEFKSKISNMAIDALTGFAGSLDLAKDTELNIEIANAIFSFDPINEQALSIKCKALAAIGRHSLAQSTYQHYCKEYQKMYGEPFERGFSDIVSG